MGATQHHFLGVDWHLRDVPCMVWCAVGADQRFILRRPISLTVNLARAQSRILGTLGDAVIKLKKCRARRLVAFLGPKPLASRRN